MIYFISNYIFSYYFEGGFIYHNGYNILAHYESDILMGKVKVGSRGRFIIKKGDYILWTREDHNIRIE